VHLGRLHDDAGGGRVRELGGFAEEGIEQVYDVEVAELERELVRI